MANSTNEKEKLYDIRKDKKLEDTFTNINDMIDNANMSIYGTTKSDDINKLDKQFRQLLDSHISDITDRKKEDVTSFLGSIITNDNKQENYNDIMYSHLNAMSGEQNATLQAFVYEAYRNKLLAQSDLHEVASQLIELSEAILIMRDAIISPDVVEGRINRNLIFKNMEEEDSASNIKIIENIEKKFALQEKIKNFIVPKTLEYGEYYMYVIPYKDLFNKFNAEKQTNRFRAYGESVSILESFNDNTNDKKKNETKSELAMFIESAYEEYTKDIPDSEKPKKEEFSKDLTSILERVSVSNDDIPIPFIENGNDSIEYLMEGKNDSLKSTKKNAFDGNVSDSSNGIYQQKSSKKNEFNEIGDCYIKMIPPTRIIPLKILNTVIGYYYILDEDLNSINGSLSSNLYFTKYDEHRRESTIIDSIAEKVVKSFDKPFLMKNIKFKELIVDCIEYYNLNEKGLKFQFIPAEYIIDFKIDVDEDGNGQSMIKKSLFYAKLYLMILLFNIMTLIVNGNDTKVNYIKSSGIDKDVANKVQEIMRIKQSRQINITDLFSYTTLINKVGKGSEAYIPVGRSGERPIETEILQGQDVNLHSDLLEMLKNGYILGTGVPATLLNYLNEPDFAAQVLQNNSKLNGRVVNYQMDMNPSITKLYKKIMQYSTHIDENAIDNFEFALQIPKTVLTNTKVEAVNSFASLRDFAVQLFYGDPNTAPNPEVMNARIREFTFLFAKEQLPMLNLDRLKELFEQAEINAEKNRLKPNPDNGDSGDDIGLEDELDAMGDV